MTSLNCSNYTVSMAMSGLATILARPAAICVLAIGFAALAGVALAGWVDQGPGIFMALVETGMAWCF